jgi:hypothetical protein
LVGRVLDTLCGVSLYSTPIGSVRRYSPHSSWNSLSTVDCFGNALVTIGDSIRLYQYIFRIPGVLLALGVDKTVTSSIYPIVASVLPEAIVPIDPCSTLHLIRGSHSQIELTQIIRSVKSQNSSIVESTPSATHPPTDLILVLIPHKAVLVLIIVLPDVEWRVQERKVISPLLDLRDDLEAVTVIHFYSFVLIVRLQQFLGFGVRHRSPCLLS